MSSYNYVTGPESTPNEHPHHSRHSRHVGPTRGHSPGQDRRHRSRLAERDQTRPVGRVEGRRRRREVSARPVGANGSSKATADSRTNGHLGKRREARRRPGGLPKERVRHLAASALREEAEELLSLRAKAATGADSDHQQVAARRQRLSTTVVSTQATLLLSAVSSKPHAVSVGGRPRPTS